MNRIGLQGASFEMDDRFGAYDAEGIEASHLDGGKMLTRINYADPASAATRRPVPRPSTPCPSAG